MIANDFPEIAVIVLTGFTDFHGQDFHLIVEGLSSGTMLSIYSEWPHFGHFRTSMGSILEASIFGGPKQY